jgi:hypothetical protein
MTTTREDLLQVLGVLSDENPELRLGQLVTNLATLARGAQVEAIWDCEDEEFLAAANRLVEHYRACKTTVA